MLEDSAIALKLDGIQVLTKLAESLLKSDSIIKNQKHVIQCKTSINAIKLLKNMAAYLILSDYNNFSNLLSLNSLRIFTKLISLIYSFSVSKNSAIGTADIISTIKFQLCI